ncbi:MAG: hypothetical protein ABTD50_12015 [Polyangiaceae bacterium]
MSKPKQLQRMGSSQARFARTGSSPETLSRKSAASASPASRSVVAPHLARTELLEKGVRRRFEEDIDLAIRRRSAGEVKLAGALRAVALLSPALRAALGEATSVLVERRAFGRELCACGLRALAEAQDHQVGALLQRALAADDAGGPAALSAACFCRDAGLGRRLAKLASSHPSHVAFGAELARVSRGESDGALLAELAPKIKESHRISMCSDLFAPLLRTPQVSAGVVPAFALLRSAERHLGRWLLLAEVAIGAGDVSALREARERAQSGAASARAAWTLVVWALDDAEALKHANPRPSPPAVRPTLELLARLSDRPSAERDMTFLFRMASASLPAAGPMLEAFARNVPLGDETAIRAGLCLARDHGRDDMRQALASLAEGGRREDLRGLAAAAHWDTAAALAGVPAEDVRERSRSLAEPLLASRFVVNRAWGALICAAHKGGASVAPLVRESSFRWIQSGRLE